MPVPCACNQAYLQLSEWEAAENDAVECIHLKPDSSKAYYRLGRALIGRSQVSAPLHSTARPAASLTATACGKRAAAQGQPESERTRGQQQRTEQALHRCLLLEYDVSAL
jgi:hypothetical protein